MYKTFLLLHILSATIWTGGHLVLALTVLPRTLRTKNLQDLQQFENGYEKIGIPALIIQVLTGFYLAHKKVPDIKSWFTFQDPLSSLVSFKLILLLMTIGLALDARLRIIPNLNEKNLVSLAYHIIPITIVSVLFVIVGVSFQFGSL